MKQNNPLELLNLLIKYIFHKYTSKMTKKTPHYVFNFPPLEPHCNCGISKVYDEKYQRTANCCSAKHDNQLPKKQRPFWKFLRNTPISQRRFEKTLGNQQWKPFFPCFATFVCIAYRIFGFLRGLNYSRMAN